MTQTHSTEPGAAPPQGSPRAPSTEERSTEFVPVAGGTDTTSAEVLLVTAYAAMWLAVFLFVWLTARRQRTIDARLGDVELALRRLEDGAATDAARVSPTASRPSAAGSP